MAAVRAGDLGTELGVHGHGTTMALFGGFGRLGLAVNFSHLAFNVT